MCVHIGFRVHAGVPVCDIVGKIVLMVIPVCVPSLLLTERKNNFY